MSSGIFCFSSDHLIANNEENETCTPLRIRASAKGFYIGTRFQRLSNYYPTFEAAEEELITGTFSW
jgi:hypothetical protein